MSRGVRLLPVVTASVLVLASARPFGSRHEAPFRLQIESLSRLPNEVHVTATSPGPRRRALVALDTLIAPGMTVPIADSITSIHVVVDGFGSIRATLTSQAGDSVVSTGRDFTLARTPGGRFARVWTVQPLLP